ncbi:unnamed protein product [Moneuplotes crassus]|uniref:EF-hand domain-containing protein n=1 Tax=Euplotes crassus TaxID=5936 RepID=A0AAD1X4M6_EUPCR|nr:unnamed protein product [Moneuplotes crassus]
MISLNKNSEIRKFLTLTGELEMKQEELRCGLCSLPNFNPLFVMKIIDKEQKGYITKYDIQRFLCIHMTSEDSFIKTRPTQHQDEESDDDLTLSSLDMMVRYFDLNKDGCLNYDEMMFILLPCTDNNIINQIKKNKNRPLRYSSYVKSQIINDARHLIRSEALIHQELEDFRSALNIVENYEYKAAYLEITELNGLNKFLNLEDGDSSAELVGAILRRIDSTGDGKIEFQDFVKFMKPCSKKPRIETDSSYLLEDPLRENLSENIYKRRQRFSQISSEIWKKSDIFKKSEDIPNLRSPPNVRTKSQSCDLGGKSSKRISLSKSHANLSISNKLDCVKYNYEKESPRNCSKRRSKFLSKIVKICKHEKKLEKFRVQLNKKDDFDPLLLFSFFDKYERPALQQFDMNRQDRPKYQSRQYLDTKKFKQSLKSLGVAMSNSRFKKFFKRYNSNNNGMLTLHEFLDIFIPKEFNPKFFKPASEDRVQNVKELTHIEHFISLETLFEIRDFLMHHLKIDKLIEKWLYEVSIIPSFQILSDLKSLGVDLDSIVSPRGLHKMLQGIDPTITKTETTLLVNRLNSIVKSEITYIDLAGNKDLYSKLTHTEISSRGCRKSRSRKGSIKRTKSTINKFRKTHQHLAL